MDGTREDESVVRKKSARKRYGGGGLKAGKRIKGGRGGVEKS